MEGQSKWSSVRRFKSVADIKRGQLLSKLSKETIVPAKVGAEEMSSDEGDSSINTPHDQLFPAAELLLKKPLADEVPMRLVA